MLKNFLMISWRNLKHHKGYSFIKIAGLTIGFLAFIIISLWVINELSYDRFHTNADRIYRIAVEGKIGNAEIMVDSSCPPIGPALQEELPEVVKAVRLDGGGSFTVYDVHHNKAYNENGLLYVDSTFFDVFTTEIITGNPQQMLNQKNQIVITESIAKRYFSDVDPIGKVLQIDWNQEFTISGVVADNPRNSSIRYNFLLSLSSVDRAYNQEWLSDNLETYVLVQKGITEDEIEKKINVFFREKADALFQSALGITMDEWLSEGNRYRYYLTKLTDRHLFDPASTSNSSGDIIHVVVFSIIALFILLIACVNYINITSARAALRAKETGIRKVMGSTKRELIYQFLFESIVICSISFFIALAFAEILLPYFSNLTFTRISIPWSNWIFYPTIIILVLIIGSLSGMYSAITLSSFNITTVLKGGILHKKGKSWFRNSLVVFQFSISIFIMISTFIVYDQLQYMQNKNLGFDLDHVVVLQKCFQLGEQKESFKKELLKITGIENVSYSYSLPGKNSNGCVLKKTDSPNQEMFHFRETSGDYDYLESLGLTMAAGRFFSKDIASDSSAIVINETAVRDLGLSDPINEILVPAGAPEKYNIIGVVKDYHLNSLMSEIPNLVIRAPGSHWDRFLAVKIRSNDLAGTVKKIKQLWEKFLPNHPFEYYFLDDNFNQQYLAEKRMGEIFTVFALLAIFIACLGLFGLASFVAQQKTREIGIRKVLGATPGEIIHMLIRQFTRWVLFANIIAWPLAWWAVNKWVQNYAYRIDITMKYFLLSAFITILIATFTVTYHALVAATANPVDSLKCE